MGYIKPLKLVKILKGRLCSNKILILRLYTSNRILRCENDEKDGKIVWNDNNAPKLLPSSWIEFLSLSWIKEAVPKLAAQSNEKRENHYHRW